MSAPARALVRAVSAAALLAAFVGASAWMQALAWGVGDDAIERDGEVAQTTDLR